MILVYKNFIQIFAGLYMRPLALIVANLFIKAFSIWQKLLAPVLQSDEKDNLQIQNIKAGIFCKSLCIITI